MMSEWRITSRRDVSPLEEKLVEKRDFPILNLAVVRKTARANFVAHRTETRSSNKSKRHEASTRKCVAFLLLLYPICSQLAADVP